MSYLSESIHAGPPVSSKFLILYAYVMSILKLMFVAVSLPPFGGAMILTMLVPEVFGLIEATSNAGRATGAAGD